MTQGAAAEPASFLARVPLFAGLDAESLALLARVSRFKNLPQGYLLFSQDEPGDAAYVVCEGVISIVLSTADGRELVINEMQPGDCFGEIALLARAPRSAGAIAREPSRVLLIPRAAFLTELEAEPRLMRRLIETLAMRLISSAKRESALAFLDADARLARVLLQLLRSEGAGAQVAIRQEELAQRAGITRQTAAKVLSEWRRRGWIQTSRGRITVLDRAALHDLLADV